MGVRNAPILKDLNGGTGAELVTGDSFVIIGGAGFIGSHFVDRLLGNSVTKAVTVFDNFSSGRDWHVEHHCGDSRFAVIRGDAARIEDLRSAMEGHDVVIHLASNPDIARAVVEPAIDFDQGTALTHNILEAMRLSNGPERILYASGSGVYGDLGDCEADEELGPFHPVSTYGASKLAGEALIRAYCHMFDLTGCAFRFGNVVGPRQTHGVGYDFLRKLRTNSTELLILGDGRQSKSYIHVSDVLDAVLLAHASAPRPFSIYNIATGDYITVKEIAALAVECSGLDPRSVRFQFTGGAGGWKGDVPVVRLSTTRIRGLGWAQHYSSQQALRASMNDMNADERVVGALPTVKKLVTPRRETRRAVFLDRDGVLNQTFLRKRKPHPPTDLTEVVVLEGVKEACSRLRSAGFLLIMITNQPDVARGTQSLETANTINEYLRNELQLDVVKMCPHDTRDGCNCRKPKPGLLLDAATEYGIDLDGSFVVGDRWKDIDAGRSAGCRTVWLDHDYDEPTATRPDFVTRTLKEASLWILENSHDERGLI